MENLSSVPIHPPFSASLSSLIPLNVNASPIILLSMPVHGAGPPIMEPAHESVSEVSVTPQPFLEMPLASALLYRDWRSPLISDSLVLTSHIYFDNLQIEQSSPCDDDSDYEKIITPYSAMQFQLFLK